MKVGKMKKNMLATVCTPIMTNNNNPSIVMRLVLKFISPIRSSELIAIIKSIIWEDRIQSKNANIRSYSGHRESDH